MSNEQNATEDPKEIPEELLKECKQAFRMFDQDNSGTITFDELASVMRILGNNPTSEDLDNMMAELDKDESGTVDFDEFLKVVTAHWKDPEDEERELIEAFQVFDKNNDGFVSANEIKQVMKSLGHKLTNQEVQEIISRGDTNGDGQLNYEEFVKVMQGGSFF